jgi:hypothetical protein
VLLRAESILNRVASSPSMVGILLFELGDNGTLMQTQQTFPSISNDGPTLLPFDS